MTDHLSSQKTERQPIVVVMGHIDHGKSTLLDYIRKANTVDKEAGGITQHISAYEIEHVDNEGRTRHLTFIDTPGHEAFGKIRSRGARVGDIAILVVAADDGVNVQTLEAVAAIQESQIPYMVAINKIDKPNADVNRTIASLIENGIYLEGYGGQIPWNGISAKTGEGVDELLDTLLLATEMEELSAHKNASAEGVVIETKIDPKAGISATLLVKNGTLKSGEAILAGSAIAPVRIMKNYAGKTIKEAHSGTPVEIIGFDAMPPVGEVFLSFKNKKDAMLERMNSKNQTSTALESTQAENSDSVQIPFIVKSDVTGSLEAVLHEIGKINLARVSPLFISKEVGDISENDVRTLSSSKEGIIVGFNVKVDPRARDAAERFGITIQTFSIIYELAEWVEKELKARSPRIQLERIAGKAKIMKTFNRMKHKQIIGAKMIEGELNSKNKFYIVRRDERIGMGEIEGLQQQKIETNRIAEGEFGGMIDSKLEVAPGDVIEVIVFETEEV